MKMEKMYIKAEEYFKTLDGVDSSAVEIALIAIRKQIPQKPITKLTAHGNWQACPNCKAVFESRKTVLFCQVCGQAFIQGGETMSEDKQAILDALLPALNLTRGGREITKLVLIGETVFICFGDYSMAVNASGDSGIAMIYDIVRKISGG